MAALVSEHLVFKTVKVTVGVNHDRIELHDGPEDEYISLVISKDANEEYSSLIHRTPKNGQENIRYLSPLEYTLATELIKKHSKE